MAKTSYNLSATSISWRKQVTICQLLVYNGENKLHFEEMMMMSALY